MSPLVLPQTLAIDEALLTLSALVGPLSSVKSAVHLQLLRPGVALPTDTTDVWPVIHVRLIVCGQVRLHTKPLPADGAGERPLPRVLRLMKLERGGSVEASATLGAQVGRFPRVYPLMDLDVALVYEPLTTVRA